jgi:hypothetical protein
VRNNPDDAGLEPEFEDDDPTNPAHRDHDLSTSANYDFDSWADEKPWYLRRWAMLSVSGILILSLILGLVLPYV